METPQACATWPLVALLWTVVALAVLLPLLARWMSRLHLKIALVASGVALVELAAQTALKLGAEPAGGYDLLVRDGAQRTLACLLEVRLFACFFAPTADELQAEGWLDEWGRTANILGPDPHMSSPGPVTWAVALLLLLAFLRWVFLNNNKNAPISIFVHPFEDGTQEAGVNVARRRLPPAERCEALVRAILATNIPLPASKPGVESKVSLPEILASKDTTEKNLAMRVAAFLWRTAFPVPGWEMFARLVQGRIEPGRGIMVEIREISTGKVVFSTTFWRDDFLDVVSPAGHTVAQLALEQSNRLPDWAKWRGPEGQGFRHYREGLLLSRRGPRHFDAARREFGKSLKIDTGNALAWSELAAIIEYQVNHDPSPVSSHHRYLEVLRIYLKLTHLYPQFLLPHYRAGIILGYAHLWWGAWKGDRDKGYYQKEIGRLLALPAESCGEGTGDANDSSLFVELARQRLWQMRRSIEYPALLRNYMFHRQYRDVLREWIKPRSVLRLRAQSAVEIAICSQELRLLQYAGNKRRLKSLTWAAGAYEHCWKEHLFFGLREAVDTSVKRDHRVLLRQLRPKISWRVRLREDRLVRRGAYLRNTGKYRRLHQAASGTGEKAAPAQELHASKAEHWQPAFNAACFYARIFDYNANPDYLGIYGDDETAKKLKERAYAEAVRLAVEYLDMAIRGEDLKQSNILDFINDPDLQRLKDDPVFKNWKSNWEFEYSPWDM